MTWWARPVFVSGTFRDLDAERDLLSTLAFPELEEKLLSLYTRVEWVDLRLGVETAELADRGAKEEAVLKVCLEEVRRCRPFMVVLLGDRYGWVPPGPRVRQALQEAGFDADSEAGSVTALEIEFGLLGESAWGKRSRIYFRNLDYSTMDESDAVIYSDRKAAVSRLVRSEEQARFADGTRRLEALRSKLLDHPVLGPRCHDYFATWDPARHCVTGLRGFVSQVVAHLLIDMESEARERQQTMQAREPPTALERFVAERGRGFDGDDRREFVEELVTFALGPPTNQSSVRIVVGPPGSGKSAVFARLHDELAGTDAWVLAHAAGNDPGSSSIQAMLETWVSRLAAKLGEPDPLRDRAVPSDGERAERGPEVERPVVGEVFADLLGRAAVDRRVVILLDALDRLEPPTEADYLSWLPSRLAPGVRVVGTAVSGMEAEIPGRRPDVDLRPLPGLSRADAAAIAEGVYRHYHRQPNIQAVEVLLNKEHSDGHPAHENALWLTAAAEELNLLDSDDFGRASREYVGNEDDKLHALVKDEALQLPGDLETLYAAMFARVSALHDAALVRAFLISLALSRVGLRERDLAALVPVVSAILDPHSPHLTWDSFAFASLRRNLRAHLRRRGSDDRWDFHHSYARDAAERAYLRDDGARREIHAAIARHLLGLPESDLIRESEVMHHLICADDPIGAARFYSSVSWAGDAGATTTLASFVNTRRGFDWVIGLLEIEALDDDALANIGERYLFSLDHRLTDDGKRALCFRVALASEKLFRRMSDRNPQNVRLQRDLSVALNRMGDGHLGGGRREHALAAYKQALEIRQRLAATDPSNQAFLLDLGTSLARVGEAYTELGRREEALAYREQCVAMARELVASAPTAPESRHQLAMALNVLAGECRAGDRPDDALKLATEALQISKALVDEYQPDARMLRALGLCLSSVGDRYVELGRLAEAAALFDEGVKTWRRISAVAPGDRWWRWDLSITLARLGKVRVSRGDRPGAIDTFEACCDELRGLMALDPDRGEWLCSAAEAASALGQLRFEMGEDRAGARSIEEGLGLFRRMLATWSASNPSRVAQIPDLLWALMLPTTVRVRQGEMEEALRALEQDIEASRKRLPSVEGGELDRPDWLLVVWQSLIAVAAARLAQDRTAEVAKALEPALGIARRLVALEEGETAQVALWVSLTLLGRLRHNLGSTDEGLRDLEESVLVARRLLESSPMNPRRMNHLAVSLISAGTAREIRGQPTAAVEAFEEALQISRRLAATQPTGVDAVHGLCASLNGLGELYETLGRPNDALQALDESVAISRREVEGRSDQPTHVAALAGTVLALGRTRQQLGDLRGALAAFEESVDLARRLTGRGSGHADWLDDLAEALLSLSEARRDIGKFAEGQDALNEGLEIYRRLRSRDPDRSEWSMKLARALGKAGSALVDGGSLRDGLAVLEESLAICRTFSSKYPDDPRGLTMLASVLDAVGGARRTIGLMGPARTCLVERIEIARTLAARDGERLDWREQLAARLTLLGSMDSVEGRLGDAAAAYEEALTISRDLLARDPDRPAFMDDSADALDGMARIRLVQGRFDGAAALLDESVELRRKLAERNGAGPRWIDRHRQAILALAAIYIEAGRVEEATAPCAQAVAIARRLVVDAGEVSWVLSGLIETLQVVARIRSARGDGTGALDALKDALAGCHDLLKQDAERQSWLRLTAAIQVEFAHAESQRGGLEEALVLCEEAVATSRRLISVSPGYPSSLESLAAALRQMSEIRGIRGESRESLAAASECVKTVRQLLSNDSSRPGWREDLARALSQLGQSHGAVRQVEQATACHAEALQVLRQLVALVPDRTRAVRALAVVLDNLGDEMRFKGRIDEALVSYQEALRLFRELVSRCPGEPLFTGDLMMCLTKIGHAHRSRGNLAQAAVVYGESLTLSRQLVQIDGTNRDWLSNLAGSLDHLGDIQEGRGNLVQAQDFYREALPVFRRVVSLVPGTPEYLHDLALCLGRLAKVSEELGAHADARRFWMEAVDTLEPLAAGMTRDRLGMRLLATLATARQEIERTRLAAANTIGAVDIPLPHSSADPDRAVALNLAHQAALRVWRALPWWRRVFAKRPEPPEGI